MAKAEFKNLDEADWKACVGQAITRCFQLAGLTQKEVAGLLGRDVAQVSRWMSGAERPQFDVLFSVVILRTALVIALAELAGVEVETHIRIKRRA